MSVTVVPLSMFCQYQQFNIVPNEQREWPRKANNRKRQPIAISQLSHWPSSSGIFKNFALFWGVLYKIRHSKEAFNLSKSFSTNWFHEFKHISHQTNGGFWNFNYLFHVNVSGTKESNEMVFVGNPWKVLGFQQTVNKLK
jgi:hypothetical protein